MATKRVPEADTAAQQAAAALTKFKEEVQARGSVTGTEGSIIWHNDVTEVLKRNQYASGGWMHSAATLQIFKATEGRMDNLGMRLGQPETQVTRVRACRISGTKIVYIVPAPANDDTALEVSRNVKGAWINLYKLLIPAKLGVPVGYKERYDIIEVEESPVGPALMLDMGNRKERRKVKTAAKRKSAAKKAAAAKSEPASSPSGAPAQGQPQA